MDNLAQLNTWLTDAEAALHKLLTGTSEVEVSFNGQAVKYVAASAANLRAYVEDLKSRIARLEGTGRGRMPMGANFR